MLTLVSWILEVHYVMGAKPFVATQRTMASLEVIRGTYSSLTEQASGSTRSRP